MKAQNIFLTMMLVVLGLNSPIFGQEQTVSTVIHFDFNSDKLTSEGIETLQGFIKQIPKNGKFEIRISGHTDQIGSDSYNQELSERRAQAVKAFILANGITEKNVTVNAFGKQQLISKSSAENKRYENRRVEIQLTFSIEEKVEPIHNQHDKSDKDKLDKFVMDFGGNPQYFKVFGNRDTALITKSGSVFFFKANTFDIPYAGRNKEITIQIVEAFELGDMLLSNLSTMSNDQPLQTMGMVYVSAEQTIDNKNHILKFSENGAYVVHIPVPRVDSEMEIFTGSRTAESNMNWNRTDQTAQNSGLAYLQDWSFLNCWVISLPVPIEPCPLFFCMIKRALLPKKYGLDTPSPYQVSCMNLVDRLSLMGSDGEAFLRTRYRKIMDSLNITVISVLRDTLNSINRRNPAALRAINDEAVLTGMDNGTANLNEATYLVFRNSNLGWANLDKFLKLKPSELTALDIPEMQEGAYNFKLIFPKERIIYPSVQENEKKHRFKTIPKNTKAILVGIGFQLGQLVLCIKYINTNDKIRTLEFKETTSDELKKQIGALKF